MLTSVQSVPTPNNLGSKPSTPNSWVKEPRQVNLGIKRTHNALFSIGEAALYYQAAGASEKIDTLWRAIYKSRELDEGNSQAAANALTALNLNGYSFSGKDLSGIKAINANLSNGNFYKANFTGAILKGVNFENANLENAVFTDANLKGANFGFYSLGKTIYSSCVDIFGDKVIIGEKGKSLDGGKSQNIYLYSLSNKCQIWESDHQSSVLCCSFSADGSQVISKGSDGIIYIRNTGNGDILFSLNAYFISKKCIEEKFSAQLVDKLQEAKCINPVDDFPDFFEVTTEIEKFKSVELDNLKEVASFFSQKLSSEGCSISSADSLISWINGNGDIFIWNMERRKLINIITGESAEGVPQFLGNANDLLIMSKECIKRIDANTSTVTMKWTSPNPSYTHLIYCPFSEKIAALGFEGVTIWDLRAGEQPIMILDQFNHQAKYFSGITIIRSFAFSSDGKQLAIGGENNIVIWDTTTWTAIRNIWWDKLKSPITGLRYTQHNECLITICGTDSPRVWKLNSSYSNVKPSSMTHNDAIESWCFSQDERLLFTLSATTLQWWGGKTGKLIFQIEGIKTYVASQDGRYLLTLNTDDKVSIWDTQNQEVIKVFKDNFNKIELLFKTTFILISSSRAQIYNITNEVGFGIYIENLTRHAVSPNNKYILLSSKRLVAVWNIRSYEESKRLECSSDVLGIGFLSNEKAMFFTQEGAETFSPDPFLPKIFTVLKGKTTLTTAYAFSREGQLAIGQEDGSIGLWDSNTGQLQKVAKTKPGSKIVSVKICEDVVISKSETSIHYWNSVKGFGRNFEGFEEGWLISNDCPERLLLKNKSNQFFCYIFDNNKTILDYRIQPKYNPSLLSNGFNFIIDDFGRIKEYSQDRHIFFESNCAVSTMAFHPSLTYLALGCENGMIQIWNTENGELVNVLRSHSAEVFKLSFSQDGLSLLSASENLSMRRYNFSDVTCKQVDFCWRSEPYALVLNGVNSCNAILDGEGETVLFDQNAKTDQMLIMKSMLKNERCYLARPYLFPPDNNNYFIDIEIKTLNIENAIILIDTQILIHDEEVNFLESIVKNHHLLMRIIPSDFHFILRAIYSTANDILKHNEIWDPFEGHILIYLTLFPPTGSINTVRELLDKKLFLILQRIRATNKEIVSTVELSEVLSTVGYSFKKENIDILAAICYSDSLEEKKSDYLQSLLDEILANPIIREAYNGYILQKRSNDLFLRYTSTEHLK